jgi:glyoxylase-like metal-dependent hydrolase (beta-lactamase superfamily II)
VRLRTLTTGVVRQKAGGRGVRHYLADSWREDTMPVHAFLIDHPAGLVLFDTGQTARAASSDWFPAWHPFFRLSRFELASGDEVAPQLHALGIKPEDIRFVILSHLHTDHVGGLDPFSGSQVLVSQIEWRRATGLPGSIRGYLPQHWPHGLEPTLVSFSGEPLGPFAGTHDIFGDGRLLMVPTPGHTPGHASLLVRDLHSSWLLAGDQAHNAEELRLADPALAAWCEQEQVDIFPAHDPTATGVDLPA